MKIRSEYIVVYDIHINKVRKKLVDILEDYGLFRVQESVFWGHLSFSELKSIKFESNKTLNKTTDFLIATKVAIMSKDRHTILFNYSKKDFKEWDSHGSI